jgi:hypothetical protein
LTQSGFSLGNNIQFSGMRRSSHALAVRHPPKNVGVHGLETDTDGGTIFKSLVNPASS